MGARIDVVRIRFAASLAGRITDMAEVARPPWRWASASDVF